MELVLADIDREIDINYSPHELNDKSGLADRFNQAFENLNEEVSLWSAEHGVDINLRKRHVVEEQQHKDLGFISKRKRTQVFAEIDEKEMVWIRLIVGDFEPSEVFVYDDSRGWCFGFS